jgi:hypothetical protein
MADDVEEKVVLDDLPPSYRASDRDHHEQKRHSREASGSRDYDKYDHEERKPKSEMEEQQEKEILRADKERERDREQREVRQVMDVHSLNAKEPPLIVENEPFHTLSFGHWSAPAQILKTAGGSSQRTTLPLSGNQYLRQPLEPFSALRPYNLAGGFIHANVGGSRGRPEPSPALQSYNNPTASFVHDAPTFLVGPSHFEMRDMHYTNIVSDKSIDGMPFYSLDRGCNIK